jgi:hypothetical protein
VTCRRAHLQNIRFADWQWLARDGVPELEYYWKSYAPRFYDVARGIEVGPPLPTPQHTDRELTARGIVGLYGWRWIEPGLWGR